MIKTLRGTNPDGTPHFHYELTQEEFDAGYTVAFHTGPILTGTISLGEADNAIYDVTEACIPVKAEHVGHLHIAIHRAHHAAGRHLDVAVPDLAAVSLPE